MKQETESGKYLAAQRENKWERLKYIIKCAVETHVGYKKKVNDHQISDPVLERMLKEQKDIRLQIENCKEPDKTKQLRKSRKDILKEMNQKVRDAREKKSRRPRRRSKKTKDDT